MNCSIEFCPNIAERNGVCASHNRRLRARQKKVIKKLTEPKAKPIPKVSPKMAAALQIYSKKKKAWIEDKVCAVCGREAKVIHHKKGKSSIELLLDERFWLPVCDGLCHYYIENQPNQAKEKGYSVSRLAKPQI